MEFNTINNEAKMVILQSVLSSVEAELFNELLRSGINPETFTRVEDIDVTGNEDLMMRIPRLTSFVNRLSFIKEQIAGI